VKVVLMKVVLIVPPAMLATAWGCGSPAAG
jgi:hypothetical protein